MALPLEQRPGLIVRRNGALSRDLSALAQRHGLLGVVLVTMGTDRMGVASWGANDITAGAMEELGDKILVQIDDGDLDPSVRAVDGE